MSKFDVRTRKHFPWIILGAFLVAIVLVYFFEDPLEYLRDLFVTRNFEFSAFAYTFTLAVTVVLSPFTIAPVVPFVAKILGPAPTFILTIIGWTIGSTIAFLLARYGGRYSVSRVYPIKRLEKNEYKISKQPKFLSLLQTRFFAAQDYLSYFLGLSTQTSFPRFFIISVLGSIPAAFIFSFSADAIADGDVYTLFVLLFATGLIAFSYLSFKGFSTFEKPLYIYTNSQSMRAGDIMATAAMQLFCEQQNRTYKVVRVDEYETQERRIRKRAQGGNCVIIDLAYACSLRDIQCFSGLDVGKRGNNIPYGVFGSLWKTYGVAISGSRAIAERLDTSLVSGIDAEDAGIAGEIDAEYIEQWSLSEILEHNFIDMEITDMSKEENHESFREATLFAKDFIKRAIKKEQDVEARKEIVTS